MKAFSKISFWLVAVLLASGFATRAVGHEAKIVKVVGSATVQLPGGAQPAERGMMVPEGATITTGPNAQVFLEVFSGGMATIAESSTVSVEKLAVEKNGDTVTSQEAMLDLKKGTVLSTLDPSKKAINHYGVRTPKGVAAARGTVYTVTVGDDEFTVETTLSGEVIITNLTTNETVSVASGSVSVTDNNTTQVLTGRQVAADPALNATVTRAVAIAAAVLSVVDNDPNGEFTTEQSNTAKGELQTLRATVARDLPQASDEVAQAVTQLVVPAAAADTGDSGKGKGKDETPVTEVDPNTVSISHK